MKKKQQKRSGDQETDMNFSGKLPEDLRIIRNARIRELYREGLSFRQISLKLGIHIRTAQRAVMDAQG